MDINRAEYTRIVDRLVDEHHSTDRDTVFLLELLTDDDDELLACFLGNNEKIKVNNTMICSSGDLYDYLKGNK